MRYSIIRASKPPGEWVIRPDEYIYSLRNEADDEFLAYHWHPTIGSRVRHPHLHIRDVALSADSPLRRVHVATGRVVLEDVIQTAIEELGVQPRKRHQQDWRRVLAGTRAAWQRE